MTTETKAAVRDEARLKRLNAFVKQTSNKQKLYRFKADELREQRERVVRALIVATEDERAPLEFSFADIQGKLSFNNDIEMVIEQIQQKTLNEIYGEFGFDALDRTALK